MKKFRRFSQGKASHSKKENVISAINEHENHEVNIGIQSHIRDLLSSCKQWASCDCSLIQQKATSNFKLTLFLHHGALDKPILQLSNVEKTPSPNITPTIEYNSLYKDSIYIPVNKLVISKIFFNTMFLVFDFSDSHSGCVLVFKVNNKDRQFEILTSQLKISRQISKLITEFNFEVNDQFLHKYSFSDNNEISNIPFLKKVTLFGIEDINCICFPVPYAQEAMHIWSERSTNMNTLYFAEAQKLRICCITWNVASRNPDEPDESVDTDNRENEIDFENQIIEFINDNNSCDGEPSDILFFAFQEIDMGFHSVVSGNSELSDNWKELIHRSLINMNSQKSQYEFRHNTSLGGVFTAVAVRKDIVDKFGYKLRIDVKGEPQMIRLGFGGKLANKSAIVYTLEAGNAARTTARIMLIGCHLTAHQEAKAERDLELRDLSSLINLNSTTNNNPDEINKNGNDRSSGSFNFIDEKNFNESETFKGIDYFFLQGDLNYRIDLTKQETMNLIEKKDIKTLLENDQLNHSRQEDQNIRKLKEGEINFLPTYKFERGTQNYDDGPKQRVPSYTDRVLYMKNDQCRLYLKGIKSDNNSIDDDFYVFDTDYGSLLSNGSKLIKTKINTGFPNDVPLNFPSEPFVASYKCGTCTLSDHRPVKALIDIMVPIISPEKERNFQQIKLKKYDEMIALSTPSLTPLYKEIEVKANETIELELLNNSFAWAHWEVKPQSDENKKFAILNPIQGVTLPGKSFVLKITGKEKTKSGSKAVFNVENSQSSYLLSQIIVTVV